jgi:hypothetical protein
MIYKVEDCVMDSTEVKEMKKLLGTIDKLTDALIWTSGSADFAPDGQACIGWDKLCRPAIDEGLEAMKRHDWEGAEQ